MQLVFLLIFLIFIFLNVILGLISARKKRKRLASGIHRQEETAGQKLEVFEAQKLYEEDDRLPSEMSMDAVSLDGSPPVSQEAPGGLSMQPPAAMAEESSHQSVMRQIFPASQHVSFLHEQTADDIFTPRYTLSEEQPPSPEKLSEPQKQAKDVYDLQHMAGDTTLPYYTEVRGTKVSIIQRLETLSPLKRAIIFSEILGTPKGLSGF